MSCFPKTKFYVDKITVGMIARDVVLFRMKGRNDYLSRILINYYPTFEEKRKKVKRLLKDNFRKSKKCEDEGLAFAIVQAAKDPLNFENYLSGGSLPVNLQPTKETYPIIDHILGNDLGPKMSLSTYLKKLVIEFVSLPGFERAHYLFLKEEAVLLSSQKKNCYFSVLFKNGSKGKFILCDIEVKTLDEEPALLLWTRKEDGTLKWLSAVMSDIRSIVLLEGVRDKLSDEETQEGSKLVAMGIENTPGLALKIKVFNPGIVPERMLRNIKMFPRQVREDADPNVLQIFGIKEKLEDGLALAGYEMVCISPPEVKKDMEDFFERSLAAYQEQKEEFPDDSKAKKN